MEEDFSLADQMIDLHAMMRHNDMLVDLPAFIIESNAIENILREPTDTELALYRKLMSQKKLTISFLTAFVSIIQPEAVLRNQEGRDVWVGLNYKPPDGGPEVMIALAELLKKVNAGADPYDCHCAYENLHPFSDGNGRSGRAIWAWQMFHQTKLARPLAYKFLRRFYYQTLEASRREKT